MVTAGLNVPQHTPVVGVRTTVNRGFTPEELAEQCVGKIISISAEAHPVIRDQAMAFAGNVEKLIAHYLKQAVSSDRTSVYNALKDAGHPDLAELIRRL
jgi:hypothetical protein